MLGLNDGQLRCILGLYCQDVPNGQMMLLHQLSQEEANSIFTLDLINKIQF